MSGRGARPRRSSPRHVWVDGRLLPADAPHLSAFDRGFQLGDGIFETLRARGGRRDRAGRARRAAAPIRRRPRHRAARRTSTTGCVTGSTHLLAADGPRRARWRRLGPDHGLARGVPRSRPAPPDETVTPTVAIQAWPFVPPPADHLEQASTSSRRPSAATRPARSPTLKTTSRADYVYARLEAAGPAPTTRSS